MTKVARCPGCGEYTSNIWSERYTCRSCGEKLVLEDVQRPFEGAPRLLNVLGIISILAVVILIGVSLSGQEIAAFVLILPAVLSGLFFLASLVLQYQMERKAVDVHKERVRNRRQRRVRKDDEGPRRGSLNGGPNVRTGARKIPLK